jgi:PAS domain S-box-containing protein
MPISSAEKDSAFRILEHVFDVSTASLFIVDAETFRIIDANQSALETAGYPKAELLALHYTDIDTCFSDHHLRELKKQNLTSSTTYTRKNKSTLEVDVKMSLFVGDDRNYFLVSATGKADPAHSAQFLSDHKESELQYEALVEAAQEGIWQLDADDNTVFVNNFLAALLDYTREEMMGKSLFNFMDEEEKALALMLMNNRKEGIAEQHEFTFRSKNGSAVYTLLQSRPLIKQGKYIGALATVLDIGKRKQAENELIAKEKYFSALFKNSLDGLALLSNEGIILDISPSIERILGLTKEDLELLQTSRLDFILPKYKHLVMDAVRDVINDPSKPRTVEYEAKKGNGERIWLESTYTNLLHEPHVKAIVLNFRDITERKNAERSLRESEARYRKAQLQGKLGHWEWNLSNNKLLWSDEIYSMLGIDRAVTPEIETFLNSVHPDDRGMMQSIIKRTLSELKDYEIYHRIILPDGTIRHVHEVADLIKDEKGTPIKFAGMVQDVTRQKRIEEELSLSETNYRLLFEQSPVPFWMVGYPSFSFLEVNEAAINLYGYTREEFLKRSVRDIRLDDDEMHYQRLKGLKEGEHLQLHNVHHKKSNGEIIIVQLNVNRIVYNGQPVWLASARDVTKKVLAETQLKESQQQLSIILNNVVDAISLIRVEGENRYRYEAVNEAFVKVNGVEKENVIGCLVGEVMPSQNFEPIFALFKAAIRTGDEQRSVFANQRFDGIRVFELTVVPIKKGETVDMILVIAKDISEQKKAEETLLKTNNELRELSSHLQKVREEERANVAREIHDELGQQLTGLKLDLSWISRKLPPKEKRIAEKIQSSLQLVDETINSVRRIATQLRPSILDDLGLAEAISWQSRDFAKRTGISMEFSSNVQENKYPPAVSIALFRVFQEALTNVARHAQATKATVNLDEKEGSLWLTIADNGVGFTIRENGHKKTLGLLGIKERVAMLNGKYKVDSGEGKGTIITVEISLG